MSVLVDFEIRTHGLLLQKIFAQFQRISFSDGVFKLKHLQSQVT